MIELELDDIFSTELATAAVYNGSTACNVIVEHNADLGMDEFDPEIRVMGTTITAKFSDVGSPARGKAFVIGSTTYKVKRVKDNNRIIVVLVVK